MTDSIMLIIDDIQTATLANGLVRIQTTQTGADGQQHPGAEIDILANQYGTVLQTLQKAGQDLQQKVQRQQTRTGQPAAPKQDADALDFSDT